MMRAASFLSAVIFFSALARLPPCTGAAHLPAHLAQLERATLDEARSAQKVLDKALADTTADRRKNDVATGVMFMNKLVNDLQATLKEVDETLDKKEKVLAEMRKRTEETEKDGKRQKSEKSAHDHAVREMENEVARLKHTYNATMVKMKQMTTMLEHEKKEREALMDEKKKLLQQLHDVERKKSAAVVTEKSKPEHVNPTTQAKSSDEAVQAHLEHTDDEFKKLLQERDKLHEKLLLLTESGKAEHDAKTQLEKHLRELEAHLHELKVATSDPELSQWLFVQARHIGNFLESPDSEKVIDSAIESAAQLSLQVGAFEHTLEQQFDALTHDYSPILAFLVTLGLLLLPLALLVYLLAKLYHNITVRQSVALFHAFNLSFALACIIIFIILRADPLTAMNAINRKQLLVIQFVFAFQWPLLIALLIRASVTSKTPKEKLYNLIQLALYLIISLMYRIYIWKPIVKGSFVSVSIFHYLFYLVVISIMAYLSVHEARVTAEEPIMADMEQVVGTIESVATGRSFLATSAKSE